MNEMTGLRQEIAKIMRQSRGKDRLLDEAQRQIERQTRQAEIMGLLSHHVGRAHAIGMGELAVKICGVASLTWCREAAKLERLLAVLGKIKEGE